MSETCAECNTAHDPNGTTFFSCVAALRFKLTSLEKELARYKNALAYLRVEASAAVGLLQRVRDAIDNPRADEIVQYLERRTDEAEAALSQQGGGSGAE